MSMMDVTVRYYAADMTIKTRNPDIEVDWRPVWDSIGLENPLSEMRGRMARESSQAAETIAQIARDGDQVARSVTTGERNVFGRLASEKFQRERIVQTELTLMPDTMPIFHVTVYKPEIHIEPRMPEAVPSDRQTRVNLQPLQSNPGASIDMRV
ncbi:hypothetical protein IJ21_06560 [Paenibacillus sp. 32O-W]|uniref:Uncharacterized protein n=2 Tax=Paenibacillus TaxID=44249 RepID=A0ABQ4N3U1_9BACL|nr:hypothetical protein IJ21_06560 [Paenibacillus sp. 32O-W]GIQ62838.1 hypothetical protein PACILC2_14060 [Paenibacillus cisolokensis]